MARRSCVHRRLLRLAAAVAFGLGGAAAPALAQGTPTARVMLPAPAGPVSGPDENGVLFDSRARPAAPAAAPGRATRAERPPAPAAHPNGPVRRESTNDTGLSPPVRVQGYARTGAAAVPSAGVRRDGPAGGAVPAPEPARAPPAGDGQELRASRVLFNAVLVQAAALLASVFLVPALVVLTLAWLVRRSLGRAGSVLRIEIVGAPPALVPVSAPSTVEPLAGEPPARPAPPAAPVAAPTARPFGVGPTGEGTVGPEEARPRLEEAVLFQVFEDNVRLRGQLTA